MRSCFKYVFEEWSDKELCVLWPSIDLKKEWMAEEFRIEFSLGRMNFPKIGSTFLVARTQNPGPLSLTRMRE